MTTHARIIREVKPNKYEVNYIYYDVSLSHIGRLLLEDYSRKDRIDALFKAGDLVELDRYDGTFNMLPTDEKKELINEAYLEQIVQRSDDFFYLTKDNEWYVVRRDLNDLVKLEDIDLYE